MEDFLCCFRHALNNPYLHPSLLLRNKAVKSMEKCSIAFIAINQENPAKRFSHNKHSINGKIRHSHSITDMMLS